MVTRTVTLPCSCVDIDTKVIDTWIFNYPPYINTLEFTKKFNNVVKLTIYNCIKVVGIEHLPVLEYLCIVRCRQFVWDFKIPPSLTTLSIDDCSEPHGLLLNPNQCLKLYTRAMHFLKYLNCENITILQICDGNAPNKIEDLHLCTSLISLRLGYCNDPFLNIASQTQIKKLDIFVHPIIKLNYLEHLTFLQELTLDGSVNMNELMEKLRFFTQLTRLSFCGKYLCKNCFIKLDHHE